MHIAWQSVCKEYPGWLSTDFGKYSSSKFRTRKGEEIQFDAGKRIGMFIGFMI